MTTLSTMLVITALALGFLALRLRQVHGDEAKVKAVPVKGTAIFLAAATFGSLLTGFLITNIQANEKAFKDRGATAAAQIQSYYALNPVKNSTAGDIVAGNTELTTVSALNELGSGRQVALATRSGKEASLQLFSNKGMVVPVLMYDGKEDKDITMTFSGRVDNGTDYPQLIPMPGLPQR